MPMNPTLILSFGFVAADRMPEGKIKGALTATAVAFRKDRRSVGLGFMQRILSVQVTEMKV